MSSHLVAVSLNSSKLRNSWSMYMYMNFRKQNTIDLCVSHIQGQFQQPNMFNTFYTVSPFEALLASIYIVLTCLYDHKINRNCTWRIDVHWLKHVPQLLSIKTHAVKCIFIPEIHYNWTVASIHLSTDMGGFRKRYDIRKNNVDQFPTRVTKLEHSVNSASWEFFCC